MPTISIRRGLRSLEFDTPHDTERSARVEFSRHEPLPSGMSVHVPLGLRDGKVRVLIGVPRLIENKNGSASKEYVYRLAGSITEQAPEKK